MDRAEAQILLIDFCGPEPLLAFMQGQRLEGSERLPERGAAAGWLPALKRLLRESGFELDTLSGVGVVVGPGSFTGVRTGLAAAKGLCEATGLKLAAVSRLAVLAHAAGDAEAVAVLHAGRGQVYVRTPAGESEDANETLVEIAGLGAVLNGRPVVIAESQLAVVLQQYTPRIVEIGPEQIMPLIRQALREEPTGLMVADANYVRSESQIYRKSVPGMQAADARS